MEEVTLIESGGNEFNFTYSWTGHLGVEIPVLGEFTFSPDEVEKLKKLLNSFENNEND